MIAVTVGWYIIIGVVVIVLAVVVATASTAITRSRRRRHGAAPTAPPGAPPRPPPQAPTPTTAATGEAPPAPPPAPAAPVVEPEAPPAAPPSYRSRLGGVRGLFSGALSSMRAGRIDQDTWDSLEEALIRADVGVSTTTALLDELRSKVETKQIHGGDDLLEALGNSIRELLHTGGSRELHFDGRTGSPDVWLFVGVNGVGKTTTIGKP